MYNSRGKEGSPVMDRITPIGPRVLIETFPQGPRASGIHLPENRMQTHSVQGVVIDVGLIKATDEDGDPVGELLPCCGLSKNDRVILKPYAGELLETYDDGSELRVVLEIDVLSQAENPSLGPDDPIPDLSCRVVDWEPEAKEIEPKRA